MGNVSSRRGINTRQGGRTEAASSIITHIKKHWIARLTLRGERVDILGWTVGLVHVFIEDIDPRLIDVDCNVRVIDEEGRVGYVNSSHVIRYTSF